MPRIQGFEAYRMAMPRGRRPESILVRVTDDDGLAGWGEVAASDVCWADIEERVGPALLGLDWELPEEVVGVGGLGGSAAASATDIACWDLWCRRQGSPLSYSLGGTRTSVMAGARLGAEPTLDVLLTRVNRLVGAGYTRVTLAVHPGWDVEPVRAVRRAFPALALQADAGEAYTEANAHLDALDALDAYGLVAIERPFAGDDLPAYARLQRRIATAVCLDPADLDTVDSAIAMGAGRMLGLRIARLGGLTAARGAHDRALAAGWEAWCGGADGFGVGQAAAVAVASLPGCDLPSDVTETPTATAVVSPPVSVNGGVVAVPLTQPGLGHDIDEAMVARIARQSLRIPA
ncbi:enolase C-terminal domain-like protein [Actinoallomurus iriomotensis]|uniref:O-succinylbenzoate synthase n=1 Tax=Actinoallomurus iriomotensis TaxID=478107 RepID=A0A9W6RV10_9ACTN|nr:enolase C-terminal domain-like protein [Actinoallomurus iriomotensis]GLY82218.1 o-succinylbenzoate synthase [Actinoallomurus iriomotensis]